PDAVLRELSEDERELPSQQPGLDPACTAPEALEVWLDLRVAIDRDQLAAAGEVGREQRGVAAGAEGGVDDGLTRLHGEQASHLVGEDGDVISRAWLQDVRQHAPHSLRPPPAPVARRRDPRSRGGRELRRRRRRGRASRARSALPEALVAPACRAPPPPRPSRSSGGAAGPPG